MKLTRLFTWFKQTTGFETPFFAFATAVLFGIGVWAVMNSPALRDPYRLIPFLILMPVHIALYWAVGIVAKNLRQTVTYLFVQGLLALALNLLGQDIVLIFGLYMAMIGITIGALKLSCWGITFISFYLGLSLINYGSLMGWANVIWWAAAVIPTSLFVGLYVLLYVRQTEARQHAQELLVELENANRMLAGYAARVEALTLAAERQRMARELHDTLSQGLAGLILALEASEVHLANQRTERTATILNDAIAQARSTLAESRRAIDDLRHVEPEPLSMEDVVRAETGRFSQSTGIPVDLSIEIPDFLPPTLNETVQRTISEGLTNMARHAHASRCQVTLNTRQGWLEMRLIDNGVGFDPRTAHGQPGPGRPGHYGLLGMEERARLAGGTLDVTSRTGAGTTLTLRLPLKLGASELTRV